jgi:hypothetical protein
LRYLVAVLALALAGCSGGRVLSLPPAGTDTGHAAPQARQAASTAAGGPTLYVAGPDRVAAFALDASGYATAQRTITGSFYRAPGAAGLATHQWSKLAAIGTVANGTLYTITDEQSGSAEFDCTIRVFGPTTDGNAGVLQIPYCPGARPAAIVGRPSGAIDFLSASYDAGDQVARIQANGAHIVRTALPGMVSHFGMAEDAAANAYVTAVNPFRVDEYTTTGVVLTPAPTGSFAVRAQPGAIALSPDGTIYVAITIWSSVYGISTNFVDAFVSGGTSAAREIGPFPNRIGALAVDDAGELFVGISAPDSITKVKVFAPNATGSATPLRVLQNPLPPTGPGGVDGAAIVGLAIAEPSR